ncbi:glycoside hydrolase family 15 protein [Sclerotinia borealis F-4128]|uniref:glucan 1,4-alpha-glucosidase n=1 Tax=Sclerotinia borealis (strain F-4128) TaxID=1432307 RepID=W9CS09_SCLBF|nr:glycoside hydrolase family 15 protein [Sclerotinia borealis F-4128]
MLWERATATVAGLFSSVKGLTVTQPKLSARVAGTIDNYLTFQSPIAFQSILNNIGPDGSKAPNADAGVVIASPSTVDPDYFYTWTRDSALTFKYLIDTGNSSLQTLIEDYVIAQAKLQTVDNLSGNFETGAGLAEPKYYTNETAFLGDWGRPQRDGPALRATALMTFGNDRLALGQNATVKDIIWPIVQNDLAYVAQYWNLSGFDLWEEINGSSFFTTAVQHRALVEGAKFATALGESCPNCEAQASEILCMLQNYWNGGSIDSNIQVQSTAYDRSGLDCNSILTSIHTFDPDPAVGCNSKTFQPCSDRALANHKVLVDSFRSIYTINSNASTGQAAAIGRYAEDVYQGGNPWYICTYAAAEQLYDALWTYDSIKSITVTDISQPFFTDLVPGVEKGTFASDSTQYTDIVKAMQDYADGFVAIAEKYTPQDGALAEQFSRENGTALSAVDLTWSYASFLTMQRAREGRFGSSWGAASALAKGVPDKCEGGGVKGTFSKPSVSAFPKNEEGTFGGNSSSMTSGSGSGTATGTGTATGSAATETKSKSAGNRLVPLGFLRF